MNYSKPILFICAIALFNLATAQTEPTRSQKLRGSITPERKWWDLVHYDLAMQIFPEEKSIKGTNTISFRSLSPGQRMQIDLQEPLKITWVKMEEQELRFTREGNVYYISLPKQIQAGANAKITIAYQGKPLVSKNPPWSGGISWQKDKNGDHFIATACQGIGASVWWPCKDHGYDEPDNGMDIVATVPDQLTAVANGRLIKSTSDLAQKTKTFHWKVTHPINNYCVNLNVGNYVNFSETITGEGGKLDLDYWVLKHDQKLAARQFAEAPRTIRAFEYWFGKYPFYEDSYKLVQVPYLGMEHQSSVTYGNGFENGYRGTDLSGTGVGLKFDFIIVHESGHEWFGNNISMRDVADMWIHESFTNYSENLFVEYFFTRKEAEDYVIGCRKRVKNDKPIIGQYGINQSGSGDMYYKGGNMLHTIRHVIDNDIRWREILRGLNRKFRHQTVNTQQVEAYISKQAKIDLSSIFDQYLRTTQIPVLEYSISGKQVTYHYRDVIDDFSMPIKVKINDRLIRLNPTTSPQTFSDTQDITIFDIDRNFFIRPVENQTAK